MPCSDIDKIILLLTFGITFNLSANKKKKKSSIDRQPCKIYFLLNLQRSPNKYIKHLVFFFFFSLFS